MHRFFSKDLNLTQKIVILSDPDEIHHIKNVLRLKKGDSIKVFNGRGGEAGGQISTIQDQMIEVSIEKQIESSPRTKTIILACAIPKKAKFESIIEKCTELGVDEIIPLITQRSEIILKGERALQKVYRYQTVALNAAKQSQRTTIPRIHPIASLNDALNSIAQSDAAFISCLFDSHLTLVDAKQTLKSDAKRIFFFIGPEGDFTSEEVQNAIKKGCQSLSLGQTTLKVDTAAIVVVAFANLYFLA